MGYIICLFMINLLGQPQPSKTIQTNPIGRSSRSPNVIREPTTHLSRQMSEVDFR
jgi:hypothetical protein